MRRFGLLPLVVCAVSLFAASQTFSSPHRFTLQEKPTQFLSVDVNHDGYADLVLLEPNSQVIAVKLNNRNGGFANASTYVAGNGPRAFVVADFNQDGIIDIALATSNGVVVLHGNSNGTFKAPVHYATDGAPNSIAYGDFNNDGKKDIATISDHNGKVSILRNTGSGFALNSFTVPMAYKTGSTPDDVFSLTAGDFNADGVTDLAYVDRCNDPDVCGPVAGETYYALVKTSTGWNAKVAGNGSGTRTLKAFDLDNDGRSDLVNAYYGCYHEPCTGITAFYSNANGSSKSVIVVSGGGVGGDPSDTVVADFNNDGILDIAAPVEGGNDPVSFNPIKNGFAVYTGKAGGRSFNAPKYFSIASPSNVPGIIDTGFYRNTGNKDIVVDEGYGVAAVDTFWNNTARSTDPCPYPVAIGVNICAPKANATVHSPVRIRGSAHASVQPANRIELWVDGKKRFQTFNDLLDHTLTLAVGAHQVSLIAVDAAGHVIKKAITIHVQ